MDPETIRSLGNLFFFAATYTPFLLKFPFGFSTAALLTCIGSAAAGGMSLKLLAPGRFDRVSIFIYLLLGWSALLIYKPMIETLSPTTLALLALGGLLYTVRVIFHVSERLRFQSAIWHSFVLLAAIFHYGAVLSIN